MSSENLEDYVMVEEADAAEPTAQSPSPEPKTPTAPETPSQADRATLPDVQRSAHPTAAQQPGLLEVVSLQLVCWLLLGLDYSAALCATAKQVLVPIATAAGTVAKHKAATLSVACLQLCTPAAAAAKQYAGLASTRDWQGIKELAGAHATQAATQLTSLSAAAARTAAAAFDSARAACASLSARFGLREKLAAVSSYLAWASASVRAKADPALSRLIRRASVAWKRAEPAARRMWDQAKQAWGRPGAGWLVILAGAMGAAVALLSAL